MRLVVFAILSAYLIISVPFLHASSISMHTYTPELHVREIEPIAFNSHKRIATEIYVSNLITDFSIASLEVFLKSQGEEYDISDAIHCSPLRNIASEEKIKCIIDTATMFSLLPEGFKDKKCKVEFKANITHFGSLILTNKTEIIFYEKGTRPRIEIKEEGLDKTLNCLTGDEKVFPVTVEHGEIVKGEWFFGIDSRNITKEEFIDCKLYVKGEFDENGRKDIYVCKVIIPPASLPCKEGEGDVLFKLFLKSDEYVVSDNVTFSLKEEELNPELAIDFPDEIECQIVSDEYECYPINPSRKLTATILNAPSSLNIVRAYYKWDNRELTKSVCKRAGENKYECNVFVPSYNVGRTLRKERNINLTVEVQYLAYHAKLSASKTVTMEGKIIDDAIDTKKAIEKRASYLGYMKRFASWLYRIHMILSFIGQCCFASGFINKIYSNSEGKILGLVKDYIKDEFWDSEASTLRNIINIAKDGAPIALYCAIKTGEHMLLERLNKLDSFEEGEEVEIESIGNFYSYFFESGQFYECMMKRYAMAKGAGAICVIIGIVLIAAFPHLAIAADKVCDVVDKVENVVGFAIALISLYLLYDSFNKVRDMVSITDSIVKTRTSKLRSVEDYATSYSEVLKSMNSGTALSNTLNSNLSYGDVVITFSRGDELLVYNESVCADDEIRISYDFEKLGKVPELDIYNTGGYVNGISLDIKGEYEGVVKDIFHINEHSDADTYYFVINTDHGVISYPLYYNAC
ncbi:MAG: hypothetical protein DRP03_03585 [Candidatus Aenigmatarchaeota archaeon]|nr:MAG: hypothetical protein DRP03_03585 [Candidatus Aenigmarchaeota archaeon]